MDAETAERAQRHAGGIKGFFHSVIGRHAAIERRNGLEALQAFRRDQSAKVRLIFSHVEERQTLHAHALQVRHVHAQQVAELHKDVAGYWAMKYGLVEALGKVTNSRSSPAARLSWELQHERER